MSSYAARFPVLEVQHTFYEPPDDALLRRWRASVPDGFEFTVKAWQVITHESSSPTYRRLKQPLPPEQRGQVGSFRSTPAVLEGWARTVHCAGLLDATAVLLQCPKSFRPTAENVDRMRSFLGAVDRPPGVRLLWEPRGDWPADLVRTLCRELALAHVADPMQAETVTPEQTYYRLHGTSGMRHVHSDEELQRLRGLVAERSAPYVMFNNLPRARDAERFLALLAAAGQPAAAAGRSAPAAR
ncbi:DUF72 domain-containing protein [Motilibacter aurantiacus]|uniref:DUF72 domain-containing protein n=1 Tax=Motilibacter aurantiacus TaxID=2714955 RepID=UPI0018C882F2|nr:DUF72 domain-containing protein [Motilibacter aurantiacus]